MAKPIKTILLTALPASGKSEVRSYLDSLSNEECLKHFAIGETVQLDDYPYVHLMRRIDDELETMGRGRVFFHAGDKPFQHTIDWGTLIELLNEDFDDLHKKPEIKPESAAKWLFERYDRARKVVGGEPIFAAMEEAAVKELAEKLEKEIQDLLDEKLRVMAKSLDGKTIVIEFARGGPDGSDMPLADCYGYKYSFEKLSEAIVSDAAILYIWVTPEESRRKNFARSKPGEEGSILFHGVPIDVMMGDYGCDDMEYLIKTSDKPSTVKVEINGNVYYLPVGRFDNRVDKTSFIRDYEQAEWPQEDWNALRDGLNKAFSGLLEQYRLLHEK